VLVQLNAYVVEECLFTLMLRFDNDLKCLYQLLDVLLALLQVKSVINFSFIKMDTIMIIRKLSVMTMSVVCCFF